MSEEVNARAAAQTSNGRRMEVWTIKKIARLFKQEPCSTVGKVVLQDRILLDEPVGQRVRFHNTIPPSPGAHWHWLDQLPAYSWSQIRSFPLDYRSDN